MGKIVVSEFVSLDGVMEAPGGGEAYEYGGWTFEFDRGAEGDKFKLVGDGLAINIYEPARS